MVMICVVQLRILMILMVIPTFYSILYAKSNNHQFSKLPTVTMLPLINSRLTNQVPALSCVIELSLVRVGQVSCWAGQIRCQLSAGLLNFHWCA